MRPNHLAGDSGDVELCGYVPGQSGFLPSPAGGDFRLGGNHEVELDIRELKSGITRINLLILY